ncbi:MAG: hypothetical protein H7A51_19710 [Akkermansiaceae bacterium]|nr:hypothetical protein [Akkermansiaceae bacterium]
MIRILQYSFLSCLYAWMFVVLHWSIVMLCATKAGDYLVVLIWAGVIIFSIWLVIVWPFYLWVPTSSFLWQKKIAIPSGVVLGPVAMFLLGVGDLLNNWHVLLDTVVVGALIPSLSISLFKEKLSNW